MSLISERKISYSDLNINGFIYFNSSMEKVNTHVGGVAGTFQLELNVFSPSKYNRPMYLGRFCSINEISLEIRRSFVFSFNNGSLVLNIPFCLSSLLSSWLDCFAFSFSSKHRSFTIRTNTLFPFHKDNNDN